MNWLRKDDRTISVPLVVTASLSSAGGIYLHPEPGEVLFGERYYPRDRGIIVVDPQPDGQPPASLASVLSHEWRHHQQFCKGMHCTGLPFSGEAGYTAGIVKFFSQAPDERDALWFTMHVREAGDIEEEWLEWLLKSGVCPSTLDEFRLF